MWSKKWLRYPLWVSFAGLLMYVVLWSLIALRAFYVLDHPPTQPADVALVLGNRAYLHGVPNPCLTGRVDEGVRLAQQGVAHSLLVSGGVDYEDQRIEAQVMEQRAREMGYQGDVTLESKSSSTLENLTFSAALLKDKGVHSVIVVSEPYHLWRVEKLVGQGYLGKDITVQYAAAPTYCWKRWGMFFKGSLREPLAVIDNWFKRYY